MEPVTIYSLKHKFYKLFIKPKCIDEDRRRKEFILNYILFSLIIFLILLFSLVIYNKIVYRNEYLGISVLFFLTIFLAFSSLLYASRRGFVEEASCALVLLFITFSTIGSLWWGFDLPAVIISYLLIIVIASILFNSYVGFWITIILSLLICAIGLFQIKIAEPHIYWRSEQPEIIDILTYSIELFFIMTISWLSSNQIEKSLKRARSSESVLKKELEKISNVAHLVEFGKLSSGIFHDLLTPLTSISLLVSEIDAPQDPHLKETQSYLKSAINASDRMMRFIEIVEKQIKKNGVVSIFCLNEEIENAIELLSYKARRAKCELIFNSNESINVYGNSLSFYQIITNLISNAIDAYDTVVTSLPKKSVEINLNKESKNITVNVKNHGSIISENDLLKIFEPFFTTKSHEKGIGLGLSHTKERIEKDFYGTINVTSNQKETVFTFSFPQKN